MQQHATTSLAKFAHATTLQLVLSDNGSSSSVLWQLWLLDGLDPEQHSTSDTEPTSHHQDQDICQHHQRSLCNTTTRNNKSCKICSCHHTSTGLVRQWLILFCPVAAVASGWVRPWTTQHLRHRANLSSPRPRHLPPSPTFTLQRNNT